MVERPAAIVGQTRQQAQVGPASDRNRRDGHAEFLAHDRYQVQIRAAAAASLAIGQDDHMLAGGVLTLQLTFGLFQGGQQICPAGRPESVDPRLHLMADLVHIAQRNDGKRLLIKADNAKQVAVLQIAGHAAHTGQGEQQPLFTAHAARFVDHQHHGRTLFLFLGWRQHHRQGLLDRRANVAAQPQARFATDHNQASPVAHIGPQTARQGRRQAVLVHVVQDDRAKRLRGRYRRGGRDTRSPDLKSAAAKRLAQIAVVTVPAAEQ